MVSIDRKALKQAIADAMPEILARLIGGLGGGNGNGTGPERRKERADNGAPEADAAAWPHVPMRANSTLEQVAQRGQMKLTADRGGRRDRGGPAPAKRAASARASTDRAASTKRAQTGRAAAKANRVDADDAEGLAARAWFDSIDAQMADWEPGDDSLELDLDMYNDAFKAVFINGLNKGMDARTAFNWAARKAYNDAKQY